MPIIRRNSVPAAPSEPRRPAEILRVGTADERWNAARALGSSADGVAALQDALRTEADPKVREAIFTSLVRIGSPDSVAAVIPCLRVDDAQLRGGALDALRAMIGVVRPVLPALLADADADVRLLTCDLVRELPTADATRLLCDVLARETEANVCIAAVDVLAEIGDAAALPYLENCAARFHQVPFLGFAVQIAMQQIVAERPVLHD